MREQHIAEGVLRDNKALWLLELDSPFGLSKTQPTFDIHLKFVWC